MPSIYASIPLTHRAPIYSKFINEPVVVQQKLNKEFRFASIQQSNEQTQARQPKTNLFLSHENARFQYAQPETQTRFPIKTETHSVGPYKAHIASAQGRRPSMEDEHIAQMLFLSDRPVPLFAVFDGHGGKQASKFLKEKLPAYLTHYLNRFGLTDTGIWNALKHALIELDYDFTAPQSGSTAVISLIIDGHIWTANIGDSRAILSTPDKAIQLSEDAKPSDPRYLRSIEKRGGTLFNRYVYGTNRRCGISIGRVFGDHNVASPAKTSVLPHAPKITKHPVLPDSTLILMCDGVTDVALTDQISEFTQKKLTPSQILAKALIAGTTDNVTLLSAQLSAAPNAAPAA